MRMRPGYAGFRQESGKLARPLPDEAAERRGISAVDSLSPPMASATRVAVARLPCDG